MGKFSRLLLPVYFKRVIKFLYFKTKYSADVYSAEVAFSNIVGKNVRICEGAIIGHSVIGDGVFINFNVNAFFAHIGRFCSIGQDTLIGGNEHHIDKMFTSEYLQPEPLIREIRGRNRKITTIGEDVWIGANVVIKKGVTIGRGAVIGAGSVVTKDIENYAIYAGVPAKFLKNRFSEREIEEIESSLWWKRETGELKKMAECSLTIKDFLKNLRKEK
jgi:acetyltransferase-like isoleucine patch superfamily enzyme